MSDDHNTSGRLCGQKRFLIGWAGAKTVLAKSDPRRSFRPTRRQSCTRTTPIAACCFLLLPLQTRTPEQSSSGFVDIVPDVRKHWRADQTRLSALLVYSVHMCARFNAEWHSHATFCPCEICTRLYFRHRANASYSSNPADYRHAHELL